MAAPRALLLALSLAPAAAKVVDGVLALSSQTTEVYIGKFSFSPFTKSTVNGTFHTDDGLYFDRHPHDLTLCMYSDAQWLKFLEAMSKGSLCNERRKLATHATKIVPQYIHVQGSAPKHDFRFSFNLRPPSATAHYWFAVMMDCYLEEYDAHPPAMKYHITLLNGNSHLPADESGMITINTLALLAMLVYGGVYFTRLYLQWTRLKQGHLITIIFAAAYAMQTLSVLCELLHLRRFERDGKGLRWRHTWLALDFTGGLMQSFSELLISVLLISLAFGWTLGLESQEPLEGRVGGLLMGLQRPAQLLKGFRSPSTLLLLSIGGSQLLLQAIGRKYEEDFNNFHDHEHWPGLLLLAIRLALAALFGWALHRSLSRESQREVVSFQRQLRVLGMIWFLCLPVFVALASLAPPYRRHQLVSGGSIFLQTCALALISTLFIEKSEYYRISSLAHMGSAFDKGFGGKTKIAVD
ncbi:hypothetical protein AB1Y20_002568 [Prymnesium parvum]|uniref:GPR180/TMEM145 transmembrane domain-containing protein n=1 Tax=Prymnesium parvum TaxID=97485 RepID=A0AB34J9E9_PRYPA